MDRRTFLAGAVGLTAGQLARPAGAALPEPTTRHLPRWRGFNLLEKFNAQSNQPFREEDFAWTAEWGFDFVRLPLDYRCWTDPSDWLKLREDGLKQLDQAVHFGQKHAVHVNLNLHRAPGYCVNPPPEPLDLWKDPKALEAYAYHWSHLARRYRGIPNRSVSFDLLNEPGAIPEATYVRVLRALTVAIRAEDPQRLIIADGLRWGRQPVPGLEPLSIAQSIHNYDPMQVTHWRASWIHGSDRWPKPTWPTEQDHGQVMDRGWLRREIVQPWKALEKGGVGLHVGEWGVFNRTPHDVALAWMRDCLALYREAGWGWALWNLRGGFGVLDSDRQDVAYEDFHGHKLDRQMLNLLRSG